MPWTRRNREKRNIYRLGYITGILQSYCEFGSIPLQGSEYCNEVRQMKIFGFHVHIKVVFILYFSLLSALCLKNVYALIKNILLLKNASYHPSFQRDVVFLLVEGVASVLIAANWSVWWLLKIGVAVAISENKTTMKVATSIDSSFHKQLFCSIWCFLITFYRQ